MGCASRAYRKTSPFFGSLHSFGEPKLASAGEDSLP